MPSYTRVPEDLFDYAIDGDQFKLYVALLSYAWRKPKCDPARTTLAKQLGWSVSSVKRRMGELVDAGLVVRHQRKGSTTVYELMEWLPANLKGVETDLERGVRESFARR